ncbi:MAG TPA: aminotransferase class III-fold pyridoxal phosphate-dependent enzyme, partial [Parvularculaceae bacterium]|nr:aminotransferase class III-fold pyridoxal phosphate-dependent enzyme [Parvularculaceae bacterium]
INLAAQAGVRYSLENPHANAAATGRYVYEGLQHLKSRHECIGDVRGAGLFFGVDLVSDRERKTPAPDLARHLVNTMREKGVLMGKIGEFDNVLKIRPPLPFSPDNADLLIALLDETLSELTAALKP